MPRSTNATFPPTPAPSTDIKGQQKLPATSLDPAFKLPPAAISSRGSTSSASSAASNTSDSSYRPISPTSPAVSRQPNPNTRKRSLGGQSIICRDDYSLPPPPTRSRKIIQMKPQEQSSSSAGQRDIAPAQTNGKKAAASTAGPTAGGKRKQGNGTTAAGRKIARKTAHSLIERRRRSKMNEEFATLKDMIPACVGQEMHKLAILQASIEYMRYLEQCITDLKAQVPSHRSQPQSNMPTPTPPPNFNAHDDEEEDDEDEDSDEEMEEAPPHQSPPNSFPASISASIHSATPSPAVHPMSTHRSSISTTANSPAMLPRVDSLVPSIHSSQTSPAIPPSAGSTFAHSATNSPFLHPAHRTGSFSLTSPVLDPLDAGSRPLTATSSEREKPPGAADEHDAHTATALLMLNTDRRVWSRDGNGGGVNSVFERREIKRGMSVRDLLSG